VDAHGTISGASREELVALLAHYAGRAVTGARDVAFVGTQPPVARRTPARSSAVEA
jgi:hypothetical protein